MTATKQSIQLDPATAAGWIAASSCAGLAATRQKGTLPGPRFG
jgi:hypothetical protein